MLTPRQAQLIVSQLADASQAAGTTIEASSDGGIEGAQYIGEYRIIRRIPGGGMGTVYEAEQSNPRGVVAIKVLNADLISREGARRFKREAELLRLLHHPSIAQIYHAGTHDDGEGGVPFFVMEYIPDALPITRFVNENQLALRQRLEMFTRACDAVNYCHQNGVIHRDLKPQNILVDQLGLPKIIDFGIARLIETDGDALVHTKEHALLGTAPYMSPEQARGEPVDIRSDVYSLGLVLYELICDRLPYNLAGRSPHDQARMVAEAEIPRPNVVCRRFRVRRDLEAVMLKALEKDREQRYQTVAALADDLHRYLRGDPVEAKRPSRWMRTVRWIGRHPVAGTVAACLLLGGVFTASMTIVGVRWTSTQPARFRWSADREICYLESRAGRTLQTLGGAPGDNNISFALLATRPKALDGGRFALYSVAGQYSENTTGGQLVVSPADDFERRVWQTSASLATPLPFSWPEQRYRAVNLMLADVFDDPQHPGDEMIVFHFGQPYEPACAVFIYDWSGKVLFEAWHFGQLRGMTWLREEKLLVVSADRQGVDWDLANQWIRENETQNDDLNTNQKAILLGPGDQPLVLFALQPSLNQRMEWIGDDDDARSMVRWYRCLLPLENQHIPNGRFGTTSLDCEERLIILNLRWSLNLNAGLTLFISPTGELLHAGPGDEYSRAQTLGAVPKPETIRLGDLPAVCKPLEQIAADWEAKRRPN